MRLGRPAMAIELSELRLPVVALLDVILFILMYFMFAGDLDAEERLLSATLATERPATRRTERGSTAVIDIGLVDGREAFRMGELVFTERAGLATHLASVSRDTAIVIRVSDDATVGFMAAATQLCHDAGFASVSHVPGHAAGALPPDAANDP